MVLKREFTFSSGDGKTKVHGIEWKPGDAGYVGVVQIIHGMVEFVDRYDGFARFLAERGFVVVGHDHLGHGATAASKEDYGFFHKRAGNAILLRDIHRLRIMAKKRYPDLPYFILGHSMGSFLLRQYLFRYLQPGKDAGEGMDGCGLHGAVVMGTGTQPAIALKSGKLLCRMLAAVYGWHHRSRLVDTMAFGGYHKRFEPCRTKHDWLSKDKEIVDAYGADERCTFRFTVNGYYNLFYSIEDACRRRNIRRMPKGLSVLLVAGQEDPVGSFGKGVDRVYRWFRAAGLGDVTETLYADDRHEILNETDREVVYQDIYDWMRERL